MPGGRPKGSKNKSTVSKRTSAPKPSKNGLRTAYSTAQRLEAIVELNKHSTAAAAVRHLNQRKGFEKVTNGMVSRWKGQEEELKTESADTVRRRKVKHPLLVKVLLLWLAGRSERGLGITRPLLIAKAHQVAEELEIEDPPPFSPTWASGILDKNGYRYKAAHGEAKSVKPADADAERARVSKMLADFAPEDIYNADETSFFYRQGGLGRSYTLDASLHGTKLNKQRLTVMACSNSTGTKKLPLFFIGNAERPRCFRKNSLKKLRICWLVGLSDYVREHTPGRQVALIWDNASCHPPAGAIYLDNITIFFFAPNLTSHVQPLDQGIIRWLKARFRKQMLFKTIDLGDLGAEDPFNITVLEAIRELQKAWKDMPKKVIANCWRHAGILGYEEDESECSSSAISSSGTSSSLSIVELVEREVESLQDAIEELNTTLDLRPAGSARPTYETNVDLLLGEAPPPEWNEDECEDPLAPVNEVSF
ncbi:hypothetical protein JCM11641_001261 [Rhodosporidiobolus odoratus]